MADLATPSAAAMGTMDAAAVTENKKQAAPSKPEKPDEENYKDALEKARKALTDAQEATKTAQARVNSARPGSKDSPIAKRQQELRAELSEIRTKQQGFKTSRAGVQDRMKALDTQLKTKITDQKTAKARVPFKSADEVDREISKLEQQVDSGKMKLVDEKKALADITALRKQRKTFAGFDESQKSIDDLKASITELRKELDNPEFKSLSDEYTKITKELDDLKAEQDVAFKDLNASRDALTKARTNQDQKYAELRQVNDTYHSSRRAFQDYEREARKQRDAKREAENAAYRIEKQKRDLDRDLEEASWPAYGDEIRSCDNLIRVLDPSYTRTVESTGPGQFAAVAQRTIDDSGIKGTKLSSKKEEDEESYFVGGGGKKGKKGKKGRGGVATPSTPSEVKDLGRFFDPGVVQQFDVIGVPPPSNQEDIASVLEKVKAKREHWAKDQPRKTQENIAAAQKKLDDLLSGAKNGTQTPTVSGVATPAGESKTDTLRQLAREDGVTSTQTDGAADITKKLEESSLADNNVQEKTEEVEHVNGDATAEEE